MRKSLTLSLQIPRISHQIQPDLLDYSEQSNTFRFQIQLWTLTHGIERFLHTQQLDLVWCQSGATLAKIWHELGSDLA